tara:strand:- start:7072 stop:7677 length:606 start_codon:yes stop_codon:yes gene_type:complete
MDQAFLMKFLVAILAMSNPIGNLGLFLGLTKELTAKKARIVAVKTALVSFIILTVILFMGNDLLNLFGITLSSFRVGGGAIVFLIGLHMMQGAGSPAHHDDPQEQSDIAVVPLSIPLVAGPGTIATVIIYSSHLSGFMPFVMLMGVIFVAMSIVGIVFLFGPLVRSLLGDAGLRTMTKIMGLLLVAIAAEMMLTGVKDYLF